MRVSGYLPRVISTPNQDHPLCQSYLDIVMAGFLRWGGAEMAREWIRSKNGMCADLFLCVRACRCWARRMVGSGGAGRRGGGGGGGAGAWGGGGGATAPGGVGEKNR